MESRAEVEQAFRFIRDLRDAFPEVMKGIKTGQLAQEMLIYKEEYIQEIGQTGIDSYQAQAGQTRSILLKSEQSVD